MNNKKVTKYGKYHYCTISSDDKLIKHEVNIEVIQQTEKSYKIKLQGFTHNRTAGQTLWVLKKNVEIIKDSDGKEDNVHDIEDDGTERYWWENL